MARIVFNLCALQEKKYFLSASQQVTWEVKVNDHVVVVDIGRVGYAPRRQFGSGQATTRAVHENGNLKLDTCTVTTNTEGIFSEQLWQIILLPRNALKNAKDVKWPKIYIPELISHDIWLREVIESIKSTYIALFSFTGSLSQLRTKLPESSSRPLPA